MQATGVVKERQSLRLFENEVLERLTHVHPITPLVIWVPVVIYFIHRTFRVDDLSGSKAAVLGLFGVFFWTFFEYVLHRFAFHYSAESKSGKWLVFLAHGNHHEDPQDPSRLVMPPVGGVILAVILFGLFRAVLGPVSVDPFFACFLLGYLWYDYTHFATHHFKMDNRIGRYLKQSHMVHHFMDHGSRWGVSSPLWDWVFGSLGKTHVWAKKPRTSGTSRSRS